MKILNADRIRAIDFYTIKHEPIASIDLMERASAAFVKWFIAEYPQPRPIMVFAGLGNNGGDGLAIARILLAKHYPVAVYVARSTASPSRDFLINAERLQASINDIVSEEQFPGIGAEMLVIDALIGSGLSRPVSSGLLAGLIRHINQSEATVVSVDIASGLFSDEPTEGGAIISPTHTVAFELPKLVFMLPQYQQWVGQWHCVPIGLHPAAIQKQSTPYYYHVKEDIKPLLKPRPKFSHKGTFGHALLVAGSEGKVGAAILAARAALRSGVGLLTVHLPACGTIPMQMAVPEAMCSIDPTHGHYSEAPSAGRYQAIGVGPGLGQHPDSVNALAMLLAGAYCPVVIDADALNLIAVHPQLLATVPPNSIFTPHPKEFERLAGPSRNDYERLELLIQYAETHQVYVVLKGAHTAIATPQRKVYFNSTGNPGMATGGAGDVLTGVILALLAQGYNQENAAIMGVYLHGLAGDLAAASEGQISMTASDIVAHLSKAFILLE